MTDANMWESSKRVSLFYPRSIMELCVITSILFHPNLTTISCWCELFFYFIGYYYWISSITYCLLHWILCIVTIIFTIDILLEWRIAFISVRSHYVAEHDYNKFLHSYCAVYYAYDRWMELGKSAQCPICYTTFDKSINSILFYCGHRFCISCTEQMQKYSDFSTKHHFPCALCRNATGTYHMCEFEAINFCIFGTAYHAPFHLRRQRITRPIARYIICVIYDTLIKMLWVS
eukprot:550905_1